MQFKFIFLCLFISFIFFVPNLVEAREPLPPRFSADAYTGVYTVGQADLMVSLDGDQRHNLYVNPQGAYGTDQQWYGDLGLGYRWIKNDAAILGWYLFAGHSRVANSSGFWITNPGVEVMGSRWDARVNAYIPVAGRSNELGNVDFNIVSEPFFTGHTEVINSVFNVENEIQQIGNGADARVGYQLFRYVPLKGYIGAYFFAIPNTDNVRGGAAGLEYWFDDTIRVFANYSYDNYQHSNVVGGIGINFGGVRKHWADPSLSERLMDPVDRYLANLGHGSGIPSKTLLYGMGNGSSSTLITDSIAFFSQTGLPNTGGNLTLANCTFENPCGPNDFTQAGINDLNPLLPNTMFYFNGGTYPASNIGNALVLNVGQGVFSRTTDYSAPATGAARSTFNGAFILNGNNSLDGVILNNTLGASTNGITSNGGQNIMINDSQIGSSGTRYNNGINASNSNITLNGSSVFGIGVGVSANNSSLAIESSLIDAMSASTSGTNGIIVSATNALIENSQILTTTTVAVTSPDAGINANNLSNVTINSSNITVNSVGGVQYGLTTVNGGNNSTIAMTEGSVTMVTGTPGGSRIALGRNIETLLVACTINGSSASC